MFLLGSHSDDGTIDQTTPRQHEEDKTFGKFQIHQRAPKAKYQIDEAHSLACISQTCLPRRRDQTNGRVNCSAPKPLPPTSMLQGLGATRHAAQEAGTRKNDPLIFFVKRLRHTSTLNLGGGGGGTGRCRCADGFNIELGGRGGRHDAVDGYSKQQRVINDMAFQAILVRRCFLIFRPHTPAQLACQQQSTCEINATYNFRITKTKNKHFMHAPLIFYSIHGTSTTSEWITPTPDNNVPRPPKRTGRNNLHKALIAERVLVTAQ